MFSNGIVVLSLLLVAGNLHPITGVSASPAPVPRQQRQQQQHRQQQQQQQQQQPQQVLTLESHRHHGQQQKQPKITGFVALGDSYSAGIGTPLPADDKKENDCRQGSGAYPFLLAVDLLNITSPKDNATLSPEPSSPSPFQWLSCTGSTTADLLSNPNSKIKSLSSSSSSSLSQIDAFTLSPFLPAFATLSIGGNDLGFFDVMNACIFRFYSFYSGGCDAALAASDAAIRSLEFETRLTLVLIEVLDKVRWELRPDFFITVTGYARFFDAETEGCDDVSLGVWWSGDGVVRHGPKLKRETRRRMNRLVEEVNAKLRRTVEGVNRRFGFGPGFGDGGGNGGRERVVFVDFDDVFEGHRFCEQGVEEPDYKREDTWFFLPGGLDGNETTGGGGDGNGSDERKSLSLLLEEDSPLVDPFTCFTAAERSGDWGEKALCGMAMAKSKHPEMRLDEGMVGANSMWFVPTYYGKTFHPVSLFFSLLPYLCAALLLPISDSERGKHTRLGLL